MSETKPIFLRFQRKPEFQSGPTNYDFTKVQVGNDAEPFGYPNYHWALHPDGYPVLIKTRDKKEAEQGYSVPTYVPGLIGCTDIEKFIQSLEQIFHSWLYELEAYAVQYEGEPYPEYKLEPGIFVFRPIRIVQVQKIDEFVRQHRGGP